MHADHDGQAGEGTSNSRRSASLQSIPSSSPPAIVGLEYAVLATAHRFLLLLLPRPPLRLVADRRGATVLFASGADLQSINPLLTVHPLARQVQRYVLLTTLARYDSALTPRPYLARRVGVEPDRRRLTFHLEPAVRWHDGRPTTARDVVWTLDAARDPATGYPRSNELATLGSVGRADDSTVVLHFRSPQAGFPDLLTDLAMLPAHLLDTRAALETAPGGVERRAGGKWSVPVRVSRAEPALGLCRRLLLSRRRSAALRAWSGSSWWWWMSRPPSWPRSRPGELDFAGIQPAHAEFVRRDPDARGAHLSAAHDLRHRLQYPAASVQRPGCPARISAHAIDRKELVEGYIYGFGIPAVGPVPPAAPNYLPIAATPRRQARRAPSTGGSASSCSPSAAEKRHWSRWCRPGSGLPASMSRFASSSCLPFLPGSTARP